MSDEVEASPEHPLYRKVAQEWDGGTQLFAIEVNEGWRSLTLCGDMYEWAADWLIGQIQGKPLAPEYAQARLYRAPAS